MALWYLSSFMFAIFAGLYFMYDPARVGSTDIYPTSAAGLFDSCRKAAVTEATVVPTLGLVAPVVLQCNTTDLPHAAASGLSVPGISIVVQKAVLLNPTYTGRIVTTYIPPNTTVMNGISQLNAAAQIREAFSRESSTGYVMSGGTTWNKIQNGATEQSKVPSTVPVHSIASFQFVD